MPAWEKESGFQLSLVPRAAGSGTIPGERDKVSPEEDVSGKSRPFSLDILTGAGHEEVLTDESSTPVVLPHSYCHLLTAASPPVRINVSIYLLAYVAPECMSVCVSLCICVSVFLSVSVSVPVCSHVSVSVCMYVWAVSGRGRETKAG